MRSYDVRLNTWLTFDFSCFRMIAAFMAVNTYLIDAFTMYAASAMAANTILRSVRKRSEYCFRLKQADRRMCTDLRRSLPTFRFADV